MAWFFLFWTEILYVPMIGVFLGYELSQWLQQMFGY